MFGSAFNNLKVYADLSGPIYMFQLYIQSPVQFERSIVFLDDIINQSYDTTSMMNKL